MNSVPLLERQRFLDSCLKEGPVILSNEQHFQAGKSFKTRGKPHTYGGRGKYLEEKKERGEDQTFSKREGGWSW